MKPISSKSLAQKWPYKRHKDFVQLLRSAAKDWFAGIPHAETHSKMPYCLNNIANWKYNMILSEVYDYIEKARLVSCQLDYV